MIGVVAISRLHSAPVGLSAMRRRQHFESVVALSAVDLSPAVSVTVAAAMVAGIDQKVESAVLAVRMHFLSMEVGSAPP